MLEETSIYKCVFGHSYMGFNQNKAAARENGTQNPTNDILKVSEVFGLYEVVG